MSEHARDALGIILGIITAITILGAGLSYAIKWDRESRPTVYYIEFGRK